MADSTWYNKVENSLKLSLSKQNIKSLDESSPLKFPILKKALDINGISSKMVSQNPSNTIINLSSIIPC